MVAVSSDAIIVRHRLIHAGAVLADSSRLGDESEGRERVKTSEFPLSTPLGTTD